MRSGVNAPASGKHARQSVRVRRKNTGLVSGLYAPVSGVSPALPVLRQCRFDQLGEPRVLGTLLWAALVVIGLCAAGWVVLASG